MLAAAGGLLALDGTSVGQFMVSRPLVAGALTGWLLGDPATGFTLGVLLELYLLVSFPVGGARFPEGAPAAVVAVATATASPLPGADALGLALGLAWGQVGGVSIAWLRGYNARRAPESGVPLPARTLAAFHLTAMGLDLVRGAGLTAAGVVLGRLAVSTLAPWWPLGTTATRGLLLLGGMVSLGILVQSFGGLRRRGRLLAAGAACGLLAGWLL